MENNRIFQYLDSPTRFLYWTIDETLSFFVPLFGGIVSGYFFTGLIIGFLSFRFYRKSKSRFANGCLKHFLYWYFPKGRSKNLKRTPPSWVREYLG